MSASDPILIVGAGLSGLVAGVELRAHGYKVIVLEAAPVPGGRMATDTAGDGRFDSGAQFFTVRYPRFRKMVDGWIARGVAAEWSRGFAGASGRSRRDGHPRYRGRPGMAAIPAYLARDLDLRLQTTVQSVREHNGRWSISLTGGGELDGCVLLLTPPLPQSLDLLSAGGLALPAAQRDELAAITYQPCLALLVTLDGPSGLPAPGAVQLHGEPISFIGDNTQKGVSPAAHAVTIHAGPQFSRAHWDAEEDEVASLLLDAASYWLQPPVREWQLRRWRFSVPTQTLPARTLALSGLPGLHFAGDVFAGPRVEGAALSGLAAAEAILQDLEKSAP